jgi:predicted house-cleaning noncanonical NTP pyrophosphatase (MazG superfamily)
MAKVVYNKLVRDLIPEQITKNGEYAAMRELSLEEYKAALLSKLVEEVTEVTHADTRALLIEELADVKEVLYALYDAHAISEEDVKKVAQAKRAKKGGFSKRLFLEFTE